MAAGFKIKYSASATPIETITANDGTEMSLVHSDIDKSVGGGKELVCGTTPANVKYREYETTNTGVALNAAAIGNDTITGVEVLIVKIKSAKNAAATDPDLQISLDGANYGVGLVGVGDCVLLRLVDLDGVDILFKSTATTGLCNVDIMWGAPA